MSLKCPLAGGLGPDSAAACWVCAGQRRQLALWLWSLQFGRALSQAFALLGSPGGRQGWIIKCVSGPEEQESRDETEEEDVWEIPSKNLLKGGEKEGVRDCFSQLFGLQLRGGEIWSEGSYLLFGKRSSPTHCWMFTVLLSAMENRGFNTARCTELSIFFLQALQSTLVLLHFDTILNFLISDTSWLLLIYYYCSPRITV